MRGSLSESMESVRARHLRIARMLRDKGLERLRTIDPGSLSSRERDDCVRTLARLRREFPAHRAVLDGIVARLTG